MRPRPGCSVLPCVSCPAALCLTVSGWVAKNIVMRAPKHTVSHSFPGQASLSWGSLAEGSSLPRVPLAPIRTGGVPVKKPPHARCSVSCGDLWLSFRRPALAASVLAIHLPVTPA